MHDRPIGYLEAQRSWTSDGGFDKKILEKNIAELDAEMAMSNPTCRRVEQRLEGVVDGAGVVHYNLYVGYAPENPTTNPLDPRNMNDAPVENIGDPARDNLMGMKEQRF